MSRKKSKNYGFALIELIIVIVILAVLAISATLKFLSVQDEAELAVAKSYAAVLQQEIKFINARWVLNGHSSRVNNLMGYGDDNLDLNDNGYVLGLNKGEPMGAPFNIGRGARACADLWRSIIANAPSVSHNSNDQDYRSYRSQGINNNQSKCTYVLRKLGDTGNRNTGKVRIIYESVTGEVSFVTQ